MKKKWIGYSIFFIAVLILFYIGLFAGNDYWKEGSPVLSYVRPFSFIDENGKLFTQKDMEGKVCVVNYFFTSCKGICPHMNNNIKKIYDEFKSKPGFLIVSHTSDPETDSAARLKHYADSMKVDTHKWIFLTGRKDSLYQAARNSYLLDDPKSSMVKIEDQFLHTQFIALVDKHGKVRGEIYDGLKEKDLSQLKQDIKELMKEK